MKYGTAGTIRATYESYVARKAAFVTLTALMLIPAVLLALSLGAAHVPVGDVARTLLGLEVPKKHEVIVWSIRLPQALAAIVAGAGLAVAGAAMQSILRNPLGSPFTLGISHAAAFGAALSVMMLSPSAVPGAQAAKIPITDPFTTSFAAFVFSLTASGVIVGVARIRGASPETMVLTGVALGALSTAGTMFLQFFADDVKLAAMVYWTFGDTARITWPNLELLAYVTLACSIYFLAQGWNYNAADAGDETAKGLGIEVERLRLAGMVVASLLTAVVISFLGVIGFVGLVVPHMIRRLIGSDHRFLLPASLFGGGLLLLIADTVARLMLAPNVLPVSVLTAFVGAPVFIGLILRGRR